MIGLRKRDSIEKNILFCVHRSIDRNRVIKNNLIDKKIAFYMQTSGERKKNIKIFTYSFL
jgi:hypothetical protein